MSKKTVLLVDDDIDLVELVTLILTESGYRVIVAEEGQDALEKVAQGMPGVILLDMRMPGMDGWQFAREFRARHDRLAPIVVLTAANDPEQRAREIDADGYLGKPFEIDDLVDTVKQFARDAA